MEVWSQGFVPTQTAVYDDNIPYVAVAQPSSALHLAPIPRVLGDGRIWITTIDMTPVEATINVPVGEQLYGIHALTAYDKDGNVVAFYVFPLNAMPVAIRLPDNTAKVDVAFTSAVISPAGTSAGFKPVNIEVQTGLQPNYLYRVVVGQTEYTVNISGSDTKKLTLYEAVEKILSEAEVITNLAVTGKVRYATPDGIKEDSVTNGRLYPIDWYHEHVSGGKLVKPFDKLPIYFEGDVHTVAYVAYVFSVSDNGFSVTAKELQQPSKAIVVAQGIKIDGNVKPSITSQDGWTVTVSPSVWILVGDTDANGNPVWPKLAVKFCKGDSCKEGSILLACSGCADNIPFDLSNPSALKDSWSVSALTLYEKAGIPPGYLYTLTASILVGSYAAAAATIKLTAPSALQLVSISDTDTDLNATSKYVSLRLTYNGLLVDRQYTVHEGGDGVFTISKSKPLMHPNYESLLRASNRYTVALEVLVPVQGQPTWKSVKTYTYTYYAINKKPLDFTIYGVEPLPKVGNYFVGKRLRDGDTWQAYAAYAGKALFFAKSGAVKVGDGVYTCLCAKSAEYSDLGIKIVGHDADPTKDSVPVSEKQSIVYNLGTSVNDTSTVTVTIAKPSASLAASVDVQAKQLVAEVKPTLPANSVFTLEVSMNEVEDGRASATVRKQVKVTSAGTSTNGVVVDDSYQTVDIKLTSQHLAKELVFSAKLNEYPFDVGVPKLDKVLSELYTLKGNKYVAQLKFDVQYADDLVTVTAVLPALNGVLTAVADNGGKKSYGFTIQLNAQFTPCEVGGGKPFHKLVLTANYGLQKVLDIPDPSYTLTESDFTAQTLGWACSLTAKFSGTTLPLYPKMTQQQLSQQVRLTREKRAVKLAKAFTQLPIGEVKATIAETGEVHTLTYTVQQIGVFPDAKFVHSIGVSTDTVRCLQQGKLVDCCQAPFGSDEYAVFTFAQKEWLYKVGRPYVDVNVDFRNSILVYSADLMALAPGTLNAKVIALSARKVLTQRLVAGTHRVSIPKDTMVVDVEVISNRCNKAVYTNTVIRRGFKGADIEVKGNVAHVFAYVVDQGRVELDVVANINGVYTVLDSAVGENYIIYNKDVELPAGVSELAVVARTQSAGEQVLAKKPLSVSKSLYEAVKPYLPLIVAVVGSTAFGLVVERVVSKLLKKKQ